MLNRTFLLLLSEVLIERNSALTRNHLSLLKIFFQRDPIDLRTVPMGLKKVLKGQELDLKRDAMIQIKAPSKSSRVVKSLVMLLFVRRDISRYLSLPLALWVRTLPVSFRPQQPHLSTP
jgi:hypothetical protein